MIIGLCNGILIAGIRVSPILGYPWHDDPAQRDKYSDHRRQRHR